METTAHTLLALLAVLVLAAGCVSPGPGGVVSSPTAAASSTTPGGHEAAMNQPNPDKAIRLENAWNRSVEMRVRVVRDATNETVHDETHTLAPDEERTAYHLAEADPDGIESFTVIVTARNTTERVTLRTNECYGDAYAEIREDGTVYAYYAIC